MTENEVFKGIHKDCGSLEICNYKETGCGDCPIRQTLIKAEKALSEIKQYRAIGTVEEMQSMKDNGAFSGVELAQLAIMQMRLKDYEAIGTIEELKALKEKSVAKKPLLRLCGVCRRCCVDCDRYEDRCPTCRGGLYVESGKPHEHCPHCGQELDWQ